MFNKGSSVFNVLDDKTSQKANQIHRLFIESGINFATGVPCGVLRHIIKNLSSDERVKHLSANRESEAIGLAAGAYLAGKKPVVYMQNSGLFAASNDIASLLVPYAIPVFFVISFRGCEGEDAIQHLVTGGATQDLLRSFRLPFFVYEGHDLEDLIKKLFGLMDKQNLPVFLLLKKGWHE